jgi:hypothetical protein
LVSHGRSGNGKRGSFLLWFPLVVFSFFSIIILEKLFLLTLNIFIIIIIEKIIILKNIIFIVKEPVVILSELQWKSSFFWK